jgi:hypothetical protein
MNVSKFEHYPDQLSNPIVKPDLCRDFRKCLEIGLASSSSTRYIAQQQGLCSTKY